MDNPLGRPELVRIHGLNKAYREGDRERRIFKDAELVFGRSEFVAVVGRSGSGKSTLLNLLAGIDVPDSGRICVHGKPLDTMSEAQRTRFRRRHVGFVFQFFNLITTLTVDENLRLPLQLNGVDHTSSDSRIDELLQRIDLADRAGSYPDTLSGGEQQRVAVARAVIHRPALVIADEPTGNLDAETARNVLTLMSSLTSENRTALLVATHSEEAIARADRVYTIEHGRLVPR